MRKLYIGVAAVSILAILVISLRNSGVRHESLEGENLELERSSQSNIDHSDKASLHVTCNARRTSLPNETVKIVLKCPNGELERRALPNTTVTFEDLAPGRYLLEIDCKRFIPDPSTVPIELAPAQMASIRILLSVRRSLSGTISTSTGFQLHEAEISFPKLYQLPEWNKLLGGEWTPVKVTSGEYSFRIPDNASVFRTVIAARAPGFAAAQSQIELRAGEDIRGIDFVLKPSGTISGLVKDERGRAIAKARVIISSPSYRSTATTSSQGDFEVTSTPFGQYQLVASAEGYLPSTVLVNLETGCPTQRIDVILRGGLRFRGYVSGKSNLPIGRALVSAGSVSATTDGDGFFELLGVSPSKSGRVPHVRAEAPGYLTAYFKDVLPDTEIRFRLLPTVTVGLGLENLRETFRGGVHVQFRLLNAFEFTQVDQENIPTSVDALKVTRVQLTPGRYEVVAKVGGIAGVKLRQVDVISNDSKITLDFGGARVDLLKEADNISQNLTDLMLKQSDEGAHTKEVEKLLRELEEIEKQFDPK